MSGKSLKTICVLLTALFFAIVSIQSSSVAQEKAAKQKRVKEMKATSQKSRGASEEVDMKTVSKMGDGAKGWPKPPQKGGEKTRGTGGYTNVNNYTSSYISVYAKLGDTWYYYGVVGPWGNLWIYTGEYCPILWASDGDVHWGSEVVCADNWNLWP